MVTVWNALFLNKPAFERVVSTSFNTFTIALLTIVFTLLTGWLTTVTLHSLRSSQKGTLYLAVTFMLNLIRSVPQIVGILLGYVIVGVLHETGILKPQFLLYFALAFNISLFVFIELVDLMRDRIDHYQKLDFYNAMRVCGIPERRIVNFHILWKNSRVHILNKLISVFGMAVFLLCSVDFIISVGLSTDASEVTLPATLGSLLAKIDSKQDILAVGYTLTHPSYFSNLFFQHLQGTTVAFLIVFTLLSFYNISNGFAERHRL
jgi:ABC-type dipeptide/oligopeptide/nickel transport system permease subunit